MKKSFGAKIIVLSAPVWCVGSYDSENRPNVMTVAWGGVCCSSPPCVTISIREATYSYHNIMEREAYTVSIPSGNHIKEADYFGIVSGKDTDKFKETGLTPVRSEIVDAPYVDEFPLIIECKVIHSYKIGSHTQFIGEIIDIKADESILDENDQIDPEKIHPVTFAPVLRRYFAKGSYLGRGFEIGKK
ncbi:MAG: flavin reductase family protein [Spirochaetes bacterium]|nr:flavin reductase family protein [Spirochaetota bacterium]